MDDALVQLIHIQKCLPIELIYMILSYTYETQPPNLLEDIVSFSQTMRVITEMYYKKWVIDLQQKQGIEICWLENDMILYANEDAPTDVGMQPKFNNILGRLFSAKNVKNVKNIMFNAYVYGGGFTAKERANILWALFTVSERCEFINL